jgi:hypothetical protein
LFKFARVPIEGIAAAVLRRSHRAGAFGGSWHDIGVNV